MKLWAEADLAFRGRKANWSGRRLELVIAMGSVEKVDCADGAVKKEEIKDLRRKC